MSELPFKIKLCCITSADDAVAAVRAGADAIGLNFYALSKRFISVDDAASIVRNVPREIARVGVFVNPSVEEVRTPLHSGSIGIVQLHGDETPEFLAGLSGVPIVKAIRWDVASTPKMLDRFLNDCTRLNCLPIALLIDANIAGQFGGTGAAADWISIAKWRNDAPSSMPIVLAGGLTSDNVGAAIAAIRPDAVDTASGVEISPGKKSAALMVSFVAAARKAYASADFP